MALLDHKHMRIITLYDFLNEAFSVSLDYTEKCCDIIVCDDEYFGKYIAVYTVLN